MTASRRPRAVLRALLATALTLTAGALLGADGSSAALGAQRPWWHLEARTAPSQLRPGQQGVILVTATNLGDAEMNGERTPIRITDALPSGVTPTIRARK